MMKNLFVACSLLLASTVFAQQKDMAAKYASVITPAALKEKLTVIASAGMEGRETATSGQKKAAAYIENYFKKIGLQPGTPNGYQLQYPVYQDSLIAASLSINDNAAEMYQDFTLSPAFLAEGNWHVQDVVFASYGLSDSANNNFDGLNVTNKWVMVIDGTPADIDSTEAAKTYANMRANRMKPSNIRNKNIKGLLIIKRAFPEPAAASLKGAMYMDKKANSVPVIYISLQMAASILQQPLNNFKDLKTVIRGIYPTSFSFNEQKTTLNLNSSNVIGVLPGTDKKNQYVFVTAHYDHLGKKGNTIWYGADDDGSGTTSVLQIATAFAKAAKDGHPPRRTMVFMTVSGEEKGLWGSDYYTDHPLFSLDSTSVDLNIDMVGRIDPGYKGDSLNYVYTIGEDKLSSDLLPISDSINKRYNNMELDRRFNDPKDPNRFYYRSDHFNFAKHGVPVIFYFNGVHADYHQPSDTVDKINFNLMAKRGKLIFYTAWAMANRDNMMKRDIPLK
ncbi:M28 family peptidase [Ilyomonas limi]|uniref:M28 family peptidase n=1 Tax=Ilyomonas limi TaxID=2575867 RepID=A0A4U3L946_9BACT|nr:M28 family peptidase [Ilyomonas limi]TKK71808.1 M28 family peptidase [Ilyomonas limi]